MNAFTPGPWIVGPSHHDNEGYEESQIGQENGKYAVAVAIEIHKSAPQIRHANARLIAASPDLYEALRWFAIRQDAIQALFDLHGPKDTADAMRENFKAARAALSKVKG